MRRWSPRRSARRPDRAATRLDPAHSPMSGRRCGRSHELRRNVQRNRIATGLGEDDLVLRERVGHELRRDQPDGDAGVLENVVADVHFLLDRIEQYVDTRTPDIDRRDVTFDADDLSWDAEAHGGPPVRSRSHQEGSRADDWGHVAG